MTPSNSRRVFNIMRRSNWSALDFNARGGSINPSTAGVATATNQFLKTAVTTGTLNEFPDTLIKSIFEKQFANSTGKP
jgi:hypothetical protein